MLDYLDLYLAKTCRVALERKKSKHLYRNIEKQIYFTYMWTAFHGQYNIRKNKDRKETQSLIFGLENDQWLIQSPSEWKSEVLALILFKRPLCLRYCS